MFTLHLYIIIYIQEILHQFKKLINKLQLSFQKVSIYIPSTANHSTLPSWLVLFAAEDEGRTEDPTELRKQKEFEKGRFAKSQEIPSVLVTLGCLCVLFFLAGWFLQQLVELTHFFLGEFSSFDTFTENSIRTLLIDVMSKTSLTLAPILGITFLMGILGNVVQVGFFFSLKPLKPDFSRLKLTFQNLVKKVLFSRQIIVNLAKTILKVCILSSVSYFIITYDFLNILKTSDLSLRESLPFLAFVCFKLALVLIIILLLFSFLDYIYQKYEFIESIKMTKEEVRQEHKDIEGNPQIKQRQRQRAREALRRNIMTKVKEADVIITNPIHLALALKYEPSKYSSPYLLAKGEDHLALVIKNLAKKYDVPIIENKPLARELYYSLEEGDEIPYKFFQVLAEIFINIESLRNRFAPTGQAS